MNFDGALRKQNYIGGIGLIVRNSFGEVMAAKAELVTAVNNAFIVEGLAMLNAMMFAKDLGFTEVMVEGDALSVTKRMKNLETNFSPIGNIIDEARRLITSFRSTCYMHIGREGNKVANSLAIHGLNGSGDSIWVEDCPRFAQTLVESDVQSHNDRIKAHFL